jgi:thiamine transport system ATP-binding protein
MLEIADLGFNFDDDAYHFDMQATADSTTVIMGKSGSGKSTLLNLIAGFLTPNTGDVCWHGKSLLGLAADQRPITTLFQQHNLFPHLSIWQNLALGIQPSLKLTADQQQLLEQSLSAVGMAGMQNQSARTLSGGEQQRVALARCLLRQKPILLMDEPFSALDDATRESMQEITKQTIATNNLCAIIVTHNSNDAIALNARTLTLENGQLNDIG